jgi:hypothetical protein
MGLAQYAIVAVEDQWGVLHDGDIKTKYATKEAAFESAAAAASLAIRQGHEVHLSVPAHDEATAQGAASAQCKISAQDKRSFQVDEEDASENSMSQEKPTDDPRQRTDKGSLKQTNEPWKQPVENEQEPQGVKKSDLERWHKSSTH